MLSAAPAAKGKGKITPGNLRPLSSQVSFRIAKFEGGGEYFRNLDDRLFALAKVGVKVDERGLVPFIGGGVAVDKGGLVTLEYDISDKKVREVSLKMGYNGALANLVKEADEYAQEEPTDLTDDGEDSDDSSDVLGQGGNSP